MNEFKMEVMDLAADDLQEWPACTVEQAGELVRGEKVTWLNVTGLEDEGAVTGLAEELGLHPLTCRDILGVSGRPKVEEFQEYVFLVMKMITFDVKSREVDVERVSLVLGKNFIVSFHERPGDVFDPVRQRLRTRGSAIRKRGSDYLAYALMDAVVDNYFTALEDMGDHLEIVENSISANPMPSQISEMHRLRKCLLELRRAVWPLREEISTVLRDDSPFIARSTLAYFRNLYDHTVQVIEMVESQRDLLAGARDTYQTEMSNRMNDTMRILTVIATIFIPITFITGLYGMNFRNMPELGQPWAYPAVLGFMLVISLAMLAYFRKKKWL